MMKYQLRYRDDMSDTPMTKLLDTFEQYQAERERVIREMNSGWASPDIDGLYLQLYTVVNGKNVAV